MRFYTLILIFIPFLLTLLDALYLNRIWERRLLLPSVALAVRQGKLRLIPIWINPVQRIVCSVRIRRRWFRSIVLRRDPPRVLEERFGREVSPRFRLEQAVPVVDGAIQARDLAG
jgi:hypothetical protein